jgi:hypothetical protein
MYLRLEDEFKNITYVPPNTPATPASPLAKARYFSGRISEGMDCTMEMVASVVPMRIPPPINMDMLVAFAHMMAPTHAMRGGIVAKSLRSKTSESRPTGGDRTDCMSSGP